MIETLTLKKLPIRAKLKPFNCGDRDLNEFFRKDSILSRRQLLTITYTFEKADTNKTVAFFSVLNDRIQKDEAEKSVFNKLNRQIPNDKRRESYPAVKVGRLGVHKDFQSQKLGKEIMDFLKVFFTKRNKTGCRFITVDAYNKERVLKFYRSCGFKFLTTEDSTDKTRLMYFDLKTFVRH